VTEEQPRVRRLTPEQLAWIQAIYTFEHFDDDGTPPWPEAEDEPT
jgi:hypothetical protein